MNDLGNPDGFEDYASVPDFGRGEKKWRAIVFRVEELEGKVPRNKEIQDNTVIKRQVDGMKMIDTIIYKHKPILRIIEEAGIITTELL